MCTCIYLQSYFFFFFFQAEDGIRDLTVTGVQTCALPICRTERRDAALDVGSGRCGRRAPSAGASARAARDRRPRHLVRSGGGGAVAGAVAGARAPVVDPRSALEQPVGALVETARVRALPFGGGDVARHRSRAAVAARPPSRRADRRRHDARAAGPSGAPYRGAGSACPPWAP